jgi:hypothetical protein
MTHRETEQRVPHLTTITCEDCGACCMEQCSPPMLAAYLPGGVFAATEYADDPDYGRANALPANVKAALAEYKRKLMADDRPPHPTHPACL